MAFQGSLEELPLPDVIQLVAASGKTGRFRVENQTGKGEIFLREGNIVHARVRSLEGEEAFYELSTWEKGEFVFEPGGKAPLDTTINKSNTNLLMAAAQRIDEWRVLVGRVPSTKLVPYFKDDGGTTPVSLTAEEWRVVTKIDEVRSIDEISKALESNSFEVSKTIYGLVTSSLVALREDPKKFPFARLHDMTPEELLGLVPRIQQTCSGFVTEEASLLETTARALAMEIDSGHGADAVADLIRSQERTISSANGPSQAQAFLEAVSRLIEANEAQGVE